MSIEEIKDKVSNFLMGLDLVISNKTLSYTGYKVNSKLFAQAHFNRSNINIYVNKKYLEESDIKALNIEIMPDKYNWTLNSKIDINELSNLEKVFEILLKCYEATKNEYEERLKEKIHLSIKNNEDYIQKYMYMEEYAFEKLLTKWNEYISFKISNSNLDELKSDMETLNSFSSGDFIKKYENNEEKYNFLKLIYEVVAYADKNSYNKLVYNKYDDKRVLALTFVRQNRWIESLISYKKYNDLNKVPEVIRNVIMYILSPEDKLAAFKNDKLKQFINLLVPDKIVEKNYDTLCSIIYEKLNKYNIEVRNNKNKGIVYAHIMFSKEIISLWDKEINYFKIQPYKGTNLDKENISNKLNENILVLNTKKINLVSNINNIFYAIDNNNRILFLGAFNGNVSEKEGLYYYEFTKIKETDKYTNELDNTKDWGNKFSSKQVISVKEEYKKAYELEVINNVFEIDIDTILDNLKENSNNYPASANIEIEDENNGDYKPFEKEITTPLNIILYGPPGTGKTYNTINYAVSIVENKEIDEIINEAKNNRESVFNRYKKYLSEKRIVFTTFHQNYSYEDFIQGIKANINNTDQLSFIKEDGIFKDLVERAKNDLNHLYVMIIDEINRGNISRVFGELITLIEEDKRLGQANETILTLPSKESFGVPPNLYIIGTMNTADKSIANIDIALRRRFDFVPMYPDYDLIPSFEHILRSINNEIYTKKRSADFLIGHAFFINKNLEDIDKIINNKIIPLLNEYFYMDSEDVIEILDKAGIKIIQNINTFQLEYDGIEE
ncbi:AAA domain-containing protein [Clostridium tertium]|uniref:5-methylcytosine-specific restriction enzyme B n=1 Tax=Clostridium tertium TaxID=1559 RepID=A0A6N2YN50_9CLOT